MSRKPLVAEGAAIVIVARKTLYTSGESKFMHTTRVLADMYSSEVGLGHRRATWPPLTVCSRNNLIGELFPVVFRKHRVDLLKRCTADRQQLRFSHYLSCRMDTAAKDTGRLEIPPWQRINTSW